MATKKAGDKNLKVAAKPERTAEAEQTGTGSQKDELLALELEEKQLRLESLRYSVENERRRREEIVRRHQQNQDNIDKANRDIIAKQSICAHKKGGKGLAGITKGHDSNYSIIKHTYPWGETRVICLRCTKEWKRPPIALANRDTVEYKRLMAEYTEAMNWPTDNEPSGSTLFAFSREGQAPEPRAV